MKALRGVTALKQLAGNLKLRQKLLIAFLVLILIPMVAYALIMDLRVSRTMEAQVSFSAQQTSEQSTQYLASVLKNVTDLSRVILTDQTISGIIARAGTDLSVYDRYQGQRTLAAYLRSFQSKDDIRAVKLYLPDALQMSGATGNILSLESVADAPWRAEVAAGAAPVWVTDLPDLSYDCVAAVWPVVSQNDYRQQVGLLRIDLDKRTLVTILAKAATTQNSVAYILNSAGVVIASSATPVPVAWRLDSAGLAPLMTGGDFFGTSTLNGATVLLGARLIAGTDWMAVYVTPYKEILAASDQVRADVLLILVVIVAVAYGLAVLISRSITRRLTMLTAHMRRLERGEFGSVANPGYHDEVGHLVDSVNDMSARLDASLTEQVRIERELRTSELKLLQAQINPHFLYNTLDLINWRAIDAGVPEISETVRSLSRFYRLTLSNGSPVITVADEVEHARMYMEIQNQRFDGAFEFSASAEDGVARCLIIKLVLQPLLENAILHGILCTPDKRGAIQVVARRDGEDVELTVSDDGAGMDPATLAGLLTGPVADSHGYGVKNVHSRLSLEYGPGYGLSYRSAVGAGTVATVRIPYIVPDAIPPSLPVIPPEGGIPGGRSGDQTLEKVPGVPPYQPGGFTGTGGGTR